jgi:hypothetical protein
LDKALERDAKRKMLSEVRNARRRKDTKEKMATGKTIYSNKKKAYFW